MNSMPYVYGHPRSGTHFVAALIKKAFFPDAKGTYLDYYGGHIPYGWRRREILDNIHLPAVYVKRNEKDTLSSLLKMRSRFGIGVSDYDQFIRTRYCDMYDPNQDIYIELRDDRNATKDFRVEVCNMFADVRMTPPEYHWWHWHTWQTARDQNPGKQIVAVDYDSLVKHGNVPNEILAKLLSAECVNDQIVFDNKIGWIVPETQKRNL